MSSLFFLGTSVPKLENLLTLLRFLVSSCEFFFVSVFLITLKESPPAFNSVLVFSMHLNFVPIVFSFSSSAAVISEIPVTPKRSGSLFSTTLVIPMASSSFATSSFATSSSSSSSVMVGISGVI